MLRRLAVIVSCAVLCTAFPAGRARAAKPEDVPYAWGAGGNPTAPRDIPEFDPATVGAIAALVAGGGVLIARRRRR